MSKSYTFDMVLRGAVTVTASTGAEARAMVEKAFEVADCNGGAWPDGSPILFEASLDQRPAIGLIDGEEYRVSTLNDFAELARKEA